MTTTDRPQTRTLRPFWGDRERTIACHRADLDATRVPNSLPAVESCIAAGAPRIEVDLRFLADDMMVVFHDPDLAPATDCAGLLDHSSYAVVRAAHYVDGDRPPVARFQDVVDAIAASDTLLQVDLKHDRPMSPARLDALAAVLHSITGQYLVGTQAHWNLPPLADRGVRVALDPGLHLERGIARAPRDGEFPVTLGLHGFWDDAPLAHLHGVPAVDYLEARIRDLIALVPTATEWMVDIDTIQHCAALAVPLAPLLHARGLELTAWTIQDLAFDGPATATLLATLFDLDVDTVMAKHGLIVGGYLHS